MENSHDIGPNPPTTHALAISNLKPNHHHSKANLLVPPTPTTSDLEPDCHHFEANFSIPPTPTTSYLEPDLPHSEISFDNFEVPNDFNGYEYYADCNDADDYSKDFSDDDDYDND